MKNVELFEMSWYIRDHLFRRYNQEGKELVPESIPIEMNSTYLRYRNSDIEHVTLLTRKVLQMLTEASVLIPSRDSRLKLNSTLNRLQCTDCKYICYLSDKEPMKCLRCDSADMIEFNLRKNRQSQTTHNS